MVSFMDNFTLKLELINSIAFVKGLVYAKPDNPIHKQTLNQLQSSLLELNQNN